MMLAVLALAAAGVTHLEALSQSSPGAESACTADKQWCVTLTDADGPGGFKVGIAQNPRFYMLPDDDQPSKSGDAPDRDAKLDLWPLRIVSDTGEVLVGLLASQSTTYSGGEASHSSLELFRLEASGKAVRVADLPWRASVMIRACFFPRDVRHRRGACVDEYSYSARIAPVPGDGASLPALRYQSHATTFPGHVSRIIDSLAGPRLRARDLKTVIDPQCSVTRILHFSSDTGVYEAAPPLPECNEYFAF